jgi:hypothetical protein
MKSLLSLIIKRWQMAFIGVVSLKERARSHTIEE